MKKSILTFAALFTGTFALAQNDIYALTGKSPQQIHFNDLRSLSVASDNAGNVLLSAEADVSVFSQNIKSVVKESRQTQHHVQTPAMAALAYSGGELIFSPMYSSNVYVMNEKSGKITLVENTAVKTSACDLTSHITRMTAGIDGHIYALNNAGTQLVRISKENGMYSVTDLGLVKDASTRPEESLRTVQTGFGGDMIADAQGNLYVLSASGNVFKISVKSLSSEYIGKIAGLPQGYSLNGAAVSADGNVIVGSAKSEGFYRINIDDLTATAGKNEVKYPVYDLASAHFLKQSGKSVPEATLAGIEVYPTRITAGELNVRITDSSVTTAVIGLYDSFGTRVMSKTVKNAPRANSHLLNVGKLKQGLYIVTVGGEKGEQLHSVKILIE